MKRLKNDGFRWELFFRMVRRNQQGASRFTAREVWDMWYDSGGPQAHIGPAYTVLTDNQLLIRLGYILKENVGREAGNWRLQKAQLFSDRRAYYQIVRIDPAIPDPHENEYGEGKPR